MKGAVPLVVSNNFSEYDTDINNDNADTGIIDMSGRSDCGLSLGGRGYHGAGKARTGTWK